MLEEERPLPRSHTEWVSCRPYGTVTPGMVARLMTAASENPLMRARLCLHEGPADPVQEMAIALAPGGWVDLHRQVGKVKSYGVLAGTLDLIFADESGALLEQVRLSPDEGALVCRFDAGRWHGVKAAESGACYMETVVGPFAPEAKDWFPETAISEARDFLTKQ